MEKSRKILVVFAILGLIITLSGMSYAYLRVRKNQEGSNDLSTLRCLGVTYKDKTSDISMKNTYAISDTEGLKTTSYQFEITNSCNQLIYAKVNLESMNVEDPLSSNHIKVWFNHENLENPKLDLLSNETVFARETPTLADASYSNNLIEVSLDAYESTEFELKLWIDEATTASEGMNKNYSGKITISVSPNPNTAVTKGDLTMYAYIDGKVSSTFPTTENYNVTTSCKSFANASNPVATVTWSNEWVVNIAGLKSGDVVCNVYFTERKDSEIEAPNNWYSSKDSTLLAALRNDNVIGTAASTPGKEVSTATEKVFASAKDDYGTSFYFRGAVENNYLEFAGMCWRIVRVTGDGSIKIVLFNRNDNNVASPCADALGNKKAFAKYDGTKYSTTFGPDYNRNQYNGFMYGTTNDVSTFAEAFQNNIDSTILTNLKAWYDLKLRTYNDMLADTIWCNDKNTTSTVGSMGLIYFAAYYRSAGQGENDYYYADKGTGPTLMCAKINKTSVDPNLSRFTASDTLNGNGKLKGANGSGSLLYKIGLLTYDEVAFAGGAFSSFAGQNNTTYYLYFNTGDNWWTMTPHYSYFTDDTHYDYPKVLFVNNSGRVETDLPHNGKGLRPAVSLLSSTEIKSGGTGTATNPYVVKTS